jgi:hypothetical protein
MNNLEKIFKQAIPVEIENGKKWYQEANDTLKELSVKYNLKPEIVFAVCSALSPRCIWNQNIIDTENVLNWFTTKYHGVNRNLPKVTTYGQNLRKAIDILKTENTDVFVSRKTFNFFNNILNPENTDYVTIDGHGINAYYNKLGIVENKHFTPRYYDRIAKAYIKGANKYGLLPCQFQAIIWLTFKRIHNIKVNWREYQINLPF